MTDEEFIATIKRVWKAHRVDTEARIRREVMAEVNAVGLAAARRKYIRAPGPGRNENSAAGQLRRLIKAHPGVSSGELVEMTGMTRGKVSATLKAIVKRGHVCRLGLPYGYRYFPPEDSK